MRIDHWVKWSSSEDKNILNTVDINLLSDWLPVKKLRYSKSYTISDTSGKIKSNTGFTPDGCGVEFTELTIDEKKIFTFGLEAWGTNSSSKDNLISVFRSLNLKSDYFKGTSCASYPEYLSIYF